MKKWLFASIAAIFVALCVALYLLPDFLVSKAKEAALQKSIVLELQSYELSPSNLSIKFHGISLTDKASKERLFAAKSIEASLSFATFYRALPVVNEIRIIQPELFLARGKDGRFNYEKYLPPKKKEDSSTLFEIKMVVVKNGTLRYHDSLLQANQKIEQINLSAANIANTDTAKERFLDAKFSFATLSGAFENRILIKPFLAAIPFEANLSVKGVSLAAASGLLPKELQIKLDGTLFSNISAKGELGGKAKASFHGGIEVQKLQFDGFDIKAAADIISLSSGHFEANRSINLANFAVTNLKLSKQGAQLLVGETKLANIAYASQKESFTAQSASIENGVVSFDKAPNSGIKLLLLTASEINASMQDKAVQVAQISSSGLDVTLLKTKDGLELARRAGSDKPKEESSPQTEKKWSAAVGSFELASSKLSYSDKSFVKELKIFAEEISIKVQNIRYPLGGQSGFDAHLRLLKEGDVAFKGSVNGDAKSLDATVEVKSLPIKASDAIGFMPPNISVSNGYLFTKGNFTAKFDEIDAAFLYRGKASVQKFSLFDGVTNQKLLGFDALSLNGINFDTKERQAKLGSVVFEGAFADIKVDSEKRLNLLGLFENNKVESLKESTKSEEKTTKPFYYEIGSVVLQNGSVTFEDEHVKPNYKAALSKLSGRISKVRPNMDSLSEIQLLGIYNNQGAIDIKGLLIPNPKNFYLMLKSDVRDVGMTPFSSYSGKYIGYEIDSGALGLSLDYQIVGRELNSNNKVSLLGFNLGNETESKEAVRLPYKLAIAILKDSKGNIDIELPVEGSTDDPKIRSGKVVWKLITQLVTKIITAPFRFIGGLFGGGDEMGFVEFDYGSSALSKVADEKLAKLAEALKQKGELKVVLEGFVDGENDTEALKHLGFRKKLALLKLKEQKKPVEQWMSVAIEPVEFDRLLAKAYRDESFPKPTNMLGFDKELPPLDMKNLIYTHIVIDEKNLLALARARAEGVKAALVAKGIDAQRLAISEAKLAATSQKERVKNSRVEIGLSLK